MIVRRKSLLLYQFLSDGHAEKKKKKSMSLFTPSKELATLGAQLFTLIKALDGSGALEGLSTASAHEVLALWLYSKKEDSLQRSREVTLAVAESLSTNPPQCLPLEYGLYCGFARGAYAKCEGGAVVDLLEKVNIERDGRERLTARDVVYHDLSPDTTRPASVCLLDRAHRTIVLAIRGTKSYREVLVDLIGTPMPLLDRGSGVDREGGGVGMFGGVGGPCAHTGMTMLTDALFSEAMFRVVEGVSVKVSVGGGHGSHGGCFPKAPTHTPTPKASWPCSRP